MAVAVGLMVGSKSFLMDFYNSTAVVAGQVLVREATASNRGEVANPASELSMTNVVGVAVDPATSVAAPTREPGTLLFATTGLENLVRVDANPFSIIRFRISGTATGGAALTAVSPAQILTNTLASAGGTVITDADVGTINMSGGLIKGKVGNNAGSIRKLTSQVNSTSCTVVMAFVNAIAVNDQYIRVPYSRAAIAVQSTTDFVDADGSIAFGTGAAWRVVNVIIDEQNSQAWVDAIATLHMYNRNS